MDDLTSPDGSRFFCYTLELPVIDGKPGSAIPAGAYPVVIYPSPHFGRNMPLLEDVPGRSEIEIHFGNYPEETRGCILVGLERAGDFVGRSREAFDLLYPLIDAAVHGEGCSIIVTWTAPDPVVTDSEIGM